MAVDVVVDVMVVGRRAAQRWSLAAALGLPPGATSPPDLAASRLAHPSTVPPSAVLLVVDDGSDLSWLRAHVTRSSRRWVPVVALVTRPGLEAAARAAGARAVTAVDATTQAIVTAVRVATRPADVIELRRRSA